MIYKKDYRTLSPKLVAAVKNFIMSEKLLAFNRLSAESSIGNAEKIADNRDFCPLEARQTRNDG